MVSFLEGIGCVLVGETWVNWLKKVFFSSFSGFKEMGLLFSRSFLGFWGFAVFHFWEPDLLILLAWPLRGS